MHYELQVHLVYKQNRLTRTYQVRPHLIRRSPESSEACRAKRTN